MLRILLSAMLVLAAFTAAAPTVSASCVDTTPDDNGVGTTNCTVPVLNQPVPNCHVLVYGSLPGLSNGCVPIVCIKECLPYDCVQDCDGTPSAAAAPCSTDANPTDDNGVSAVCTYAGIRCSVGALAFGPWLQEPPVDYGCQLPIYCFRECGPPMATASQPLPCRGTADTDTLSASFTCPVGLCEVGPVVSNGRYDHAIRCSPLIVCVTEPCPGSGEIEI